MANNISGGGCFKTYPSTNLDYTSGAILPIANIKVLRIRLRKPDPSNPYVNTWAGHLNVFLRIYKSGKQYY